MEPRNRIDEWLDKGLAECGNAEPRAGLENRILANLSAEKNRVSRRRRWRWALSVGFATVVVAVSVWLDRRPNAPPAPARENQTAKMQSLERTGEALPQVAPRSRPEESANTAVTGKMDAPFSRNRMTKRPKLDQFPSSRPLPDRADQLKLLQDYVNATPREEIIAVIERAKDTSDLQVRDLEIPPLDREIRASESSEPN